MSNSLHDMGISIDDDQGDRQKKVILRWISSLKERRPFDRPQPWMRARAGWGCHRLDETLASVAMKFPFLSRHLVHRTVYAEMPPRTKYRQTAAAKDLTDVYMALKRWSLAHRDLLREPD
jgi:VanZ family protein